MSQAKHRLFIGNIPKSLTDDDLRKAIEESGPGAENIELFKVDFSLLTKMVLLLLKRHPIVYLSYFYL